MTLTVTHTTPADGTFSATGAAAWDANHALTVSGTSGQVQFNSSGDLAGDTGLTFDATNKALTVGGGTVTASFPALSASQTWNNAAVTFTALKVDVTDTASNASSLLMDLRYGGAGKFSVRKDGSPLVTTQFQGYRLSGYTSPAIAQVSGWTGISNISAGVLIYPDSQPVGVGYGQVGLGSYGVRVANTGAFAFSNSTADGSSDTYLTRKAAANLRFGAADAAAPVAQTLSVQSVVAGTTNTIGRNLTITGSQSTGNAAGGSIIFQTAAANTGGGATVQNTLADAMVIDSVKTVRLGTGYTVATLPAAGTAGRRTYVTDALAPVYLGVLTGGGSVVCPVFDNGTAWVSA